MAHTLGTELQKVRKMKGLSLSAVAKPAGISATYLQKLERNEVDEPSPLKLSRVAEVLGLDYSDVLRLAGYPIPKAADSNEPEQSQTLIDVDLATADASLLRQVLRSPEQVSDDELEQLARYLAFLRQQQSVA
jgi:transcriptional regulator with XRE-family HTH domain